MQIVQWDPTSLKEKAGKNKQQKMCVAKPVARP